MFLTYTPPLEMGQDQVESGHAQSVCQNEDPTAFPHWPAWMLIISLGIAKDKVMKE